jgi:hypothetical protein
VSLRLTTSFKTARLEEPNAELGLVKEAEQRQRSVMEANISNSDSHV